jgi:hypothetical protein
MSFAMAVGTDLVYNIVEHLLEGTVDGHGFCARAVSGGRAGSKTPGVVNRMLANNPYLTHVKESKEHPGGPIVMGKYHLRTHESNLNWIRLEPYPNNEMFGRAGFAIHGRGRIGSQGCIVPTDFAAVLTLYKLVKAREVAGKPAPTLAVVAIGDLDAVDRRLRQIARTA